MTLWLGAATLPEQDTRGGASDLSTDDPIVRATLHYLGHRGQMLTPALSERLDETIAHCMQVARPKVASCGCQPDSIKLPGADIARHLFGAVEVILMAVTLGHGVDQELRRLSFIDPLGQVLFDAAATALVEHHADKLEARIRAEARARGFYCSWRFSPGYGDLPLSTQSDVLARLDANKRLGITLTESNLMVPTKSVTALVGVHPIPQPGLAPSCDICTLQPHCLLRKQGVTCRA